MYKYTQPNISIITTGLMFIIMFIIELCLLCEACNMYVPYIHNSNQSIYQSIWLMKISRVFLESVSYQRRTMESCIHLLEQNITSEHKYIEMICNKNLCMSHLLSQAPISLVVVANYSQNTHNAITEASLNCATPNWQAGFVTSVWFSSHKNSAICSKELETRLV